VSSRKEVSSDGPLRAVLLLTALAWVLVYAWSQSAGGGGGEVAAAAQSNCPSGGAPPFREVSFERWRQLQEEIPAQVLFGTDLDPYEQGMVGPQLAWTDEEPSMRPLADYEGTVPAGYEIRWWAPTRHNVVADLMLFEDARGAREFVDRAASTRCREKATAAPASFPAGGRNLEWRNPYGFMQQDLFLARGARVYRLSVVPPGDTGMPMEERREEGFRLVNALGAALLGDDRAVYEPGSAA
jgi:hypothetical protein